NPTKESAEEADETHGRLALGQDVARRGEEGYGRERGRGHEAVDLGRDRGNRRAVAEEKEKSDPAHRDEDGGTQERREEYDKGERDDHVDCELGDAPEPEDRRDRRQGDEPAGKPLRGRPREVQGEERESQRHHHREDPLGDAARQELALLAADPDEIDGGAR